MNDYKEYSIKLYGCMRYMNDFKYVFSDMLNIIEMYHDEDYTPSDVAKLLGGEDDHDLLVVCQYDELETSIEFQKLGLKKGIDYVYAESLFYLLDFPIREISKSRDVYLWGIGDRGHVFCHEFVELYPDIEIVGCIDSAEEKQHKTWFRRPVYAPDDVIKKDCFVIISSDEYYDIISEYLIDHGKAYGKDFVHWTAVNKKASWMMRETVYDRPRLNYVCPKPFKDSILGDKGRLSVCAGIRGMGTWGVPGYYGDFSSIWHSNIMKVLRLSVVNGTYSFCDHVKCNYLFETGQREIDLDELHYYTSRSRESLDVIAKKEFYEKDHVFDQKNYQIVEDDYPEVVLLSFDQTCNLYCASCRESVFVESGARRRQMENFDKRMQKELYPFIKRLKASGAGEVFASKIHQELIFDKDFAGKVERIGILSNGSLLTPDKFDKLYDLYREIKIFISMDGATKETAEKLRRGIQFDAWKSNMEYLGRMRREGKIAQLSFNFVVQRDNYMEMPQFVNMCLSFSADAIKFSKIERSRTISDEEFSKISMFDQDGEMLPELKNIIKDNVFNSPEVFLFRWVDW